MPTIDKGKGRATEEDEGAHGEQEATQLRVEVSAKADVSERFICSEGSVPAFVVHECVVWIAVLTTYPRLSHNMRTLYPRSSNHCPVRFVWI